MKYKVVCYMRIDCDEEVETLHDDPSDAESEKEHCELMQPENIYVVEEVEDELERKEY